MITKREISLLIVIMVLSILVIYLRYFTPPRIQIQREIKTVYAIPNELEGWIYPFEVYQVGENDERTKGRLIIKNNEIIFEKLEGIEGEISP